MCYLRLVARSKTVGWTTDRASRGGLEAELQRGPGAPGQGVKFPEAESFLLGVGKLPPPLLDRPFTLEKTHRICANPKNTLLQKWGGHIPSPPLGHAPDLSLLLIYIIYIYIYIYIGNIKFRIENYYFETRKPFGSEVQWLTRSAVDITRAFFTIVPTRWWHALTQGSKQDLFSPPLSLICACCTLSRQQNRIDCSLSLQGNKIFVFRISGSRLYAATCPKSKPVGHRQTVTLYWATIDCNTVRMQSQSWNTKVHSTVCGNNCWL